MATEMAVLAPASMALKPNPTMKERVVRIFAYHRSDIPWGGNARLVLLLKDMIAMSTSGAASAASRAHATTRKASGMSRVILALSADDSSAASQSFEGAVGETDHPEGENK